MLIPSLGVFLRTIFFEGGCMPFIIVFNIIVCVVFGLVLITLLGCSVATKDCAKRPPEVAQKIQLKIDKVRAIAYIVFLAIAILMILVNIIF